MDRPTEPAPPLREHHVTRRRHWPVVLGVFLLALLAWPLFRWKELSSDALREVLKAEMLRVSDSVYVLQISPVHLRLFPGAIAFDSVLLTTDSARRLAYPGRPALRIAATSCQLSGVDVWKLIQKQGLYGKLFRCGGVNVGASVATTGTPASPAVKHRKLDFLKLQRDFHLPETLPVLAVQLVDFPDIELDLTRNRADLPAQSFALKKFSARFEDVVIDPQEPASQRRPLFSTQIALAAQELAVGSGDATVGFRSMSADLDEGSFTLHGIHADPAGAPKAWFKQQQYRRPWVKLSADSIRFAGIDLALLVREGEVVTERVIIGGLDVSVETDASLPMAPRSAARHASDLHEAASAATTGVRVEADSVRVIDGRVHYVGHRPGHPDEVISAPRISFAAANVLVDPALPRAQQRPLLARVLELGLDSVSWATGDSLKSMTIGDLHLRTTDSVLVARRIVVGPSLSDSAWMQRQTVRQTLGRATIDSIVMRGVNYDQLVTGGGLRVRDIAMEGAGVRMVRNMALPSPRTGAEPTRPVLDSTLADIGIRARIGGVAANGRLTFVELHPGLPPREFLVRRLRLTGTALDIGDDSSRVRAARPLLSQRMTLTLTDITRHWGTTQSIAIGEIAANLGDSTLTVDSVRLAPPFSPKPRRTRLHVVLDSLRFAGVDYVALADGRRAAVRQAIVGNAGIDVQVDAGVPGSDHGAAARSSVPAPQAAFSGFDVPISVGAVRLLRGRVRLAQVRSGRTTLLVSAERFTVAGRKLGYERGVTPPLLSQDIVLRATGLTVSADSAQGRAQTVAIRLGDSTIAVDGVSLRLAGAASDSTSGKKSGVTVAADSVRLAGVDVDALRQGKAARMRHALVARLDLEVRRTSGGKEKDSTPPVSRSQVMKQAGMPIDIGHFEVPGARVRVFKDRPGGTPSVISVRRASLSATQVAFDPSASLAEQRHPAQQVTVSADDIVVSDNPMNSFLIGSLGASLHDSTLSVRDVRIGPTVSDSVWVSRQNHRSTRIKVKTDSVLVAGLDFDRLLENEGLWLRHGRVFALDIDAYSNKNLPSDSVKKLHSTAQQDVQSIKFPFGIDTMSVSDGEVVYRELDAGKPEPGQVLFTAITATVTGFTSRGVAGESPPLRIAAHTMLFGEGALDAYAEAPLTSSGYDVVYHGRLGPMPAAAINMFAEKSLPVVIEGGQFDEVTFSVSAKDGHAVGDIVPIYSGIKLKLRDARASFLKKLEYSVLTFVAKEFIIRHNNPPKEGHPPRVGTIDHTFAGETIVDFLWYALRGGIEKAILK